MNHRIQVANISLTSRCNLSCKHCGASSGIDEIPTNKLIDIIMELKNYSVKHIIFAGGEPFLRSDIFQVLDVCESLKISYAILTNGTVTNSDRIQRLSQYHFLSYVRISVDYSTGEKMDEFRGMNGLMDKINVTTKLLQEYNIPFGIGFTIMEDNMEDMYQVAMWAKTTGAAFFRASPVVSIGKCSEIHYNEKFYCKAIRNIIEVRKRMNIGEEYPFIMLPNTLSNISNAFLLACPGSEYEISIMADGTVNRCPLSQSDKKINIYNMHFEKTIDMLKTDCQNKLKLYLTNAQCKNCKEIEKCKGGCYVEIESSIDGAPLCMKNIVETVCDEYGKEYRRILSNILYEQKLRGCQPGCMRSTAFWVIPFYI